MSTPLLRRVTVEGLTRTARRAVDEGALEAARRIIDDVDRRGRAAVVEHGVRLGDVAPGEPLVYTRAELERALGSMDAGSRRVLESAARSIRSFAEAQRAALLDVEIAVPGGRAGHRFVPVGTAGCYAPGGRYPLPSTVLMTVVTARAAGVGTVCVASPRPARVTLAAAAIAGADLLLGIGGAQAIGALVNGFDDVPACDVIAGPGNRYVTAAKHAVAGRVRIDMLAGPSEVLVIADEGADARLIAADLLAQAEHDDDAVPGLVTTSAALVEDVERELDAQLATLPTARTARRALENGFACVVVSLEEAVVVSERLAPEHVQLMTREDERLARGLRNYGALFIGARSAETLGDYGVGPNHTLPTGGTARFASGLSVLTFLNTRTWLRLDEGAPDAVFRDAAAFARMEGLEGHARAAEARGTGTTAGRPDS